jgi:hypothetical protein
VSRDNFVPNITEDFVNDNGGFRNVSWIPLKPQRGKPAKSLLEAAAALHLSGHVTVLFVIDAESSDLSPEGCLVDTQLSGCGYLLALVSH